MLKTVFNYLLKITLCIAIIAGSGCRVSDDAQFTCTDSIGCVDIPPGESIKIGVLQALSGSITPLGEAQILGFKLALHKRDNVIHNHAVSLQIEDTGCTSEGGANAVLKVIADPQTVAIFGTTCSGAAATASSAMSSAGLTMISGNNSAPFLTSIGGTKAPDWHPGYFRTANNEEYAGAVAAEYAYHVLNIREAAAIHDNDIYTQGLVHSFTSAFENMGGKVVLETAVNKGESDMKPVLEAVIKSGAELLFFPLFPPEGKNIINQANERQQFRDIILMSDGALIQQSFLEEVGAAAEGMLFVGPAKPKGEAVDMLEIAYEDLFNESPQVAYYITGYDAADLLLTAIEDIAVLDTSGVLHIGRQALRDRLYSTKSFKGVSGTLNCNQFGDCAEPAFNVLRFDDPSAGLQGLETNILYSGNALK